VKQVKMYSAQVSGFQITTLETLVNVGLPRLVQCQH